MFGPFWHETSRLSDGAVLPVHAVAEKLDDTATPRAFDVPAANQTAIGVPLEHTPPGVQTSAALEVLDYGAGLL